MDTNLAFGHDLDVDFKHNEAQIKVQRSEMGGL